MGRGRRSRDSDSEEESSTGGPSRARSRSRSPSGSEVGASRGRGGYRSAELSTIPANVSIYRASEKFRSTKKEALLFANYLRLTRVKEEKLVYKYRVDFEPDVESLKLRRTLFVRAFRELFTGKEADYDGTHDATSIERLPQEERVVLVEDPETRKKYKVKIKRVGTINFNSFELLRLYNIQMKKFLQALNFWQVNRTGAYVHSELVTDVGMDMCLIRGFRTAANIHDGGHILMNLEPCHKVVQKINVLQYLEKIRRESSHARGSSLVEAVKSAIVGKLVITDYNNYVYRVEDVDFASNPTSTFKKRNSNVDISYVDYFREQHGKQIRDLGQPLLNVVNNNKRKEQAEVGKVIKIVPELCNIAGLTEEQRKDYQVKNSMLRATQVDPRDRVTQLCDFIKKLNSNEQVQERLNNWGYRYEPPEHPIKVKGFKLNRTQIGVGRVAQGNPRSWPEADEDGGFDKIVTSSQVATSNTIPNMAIVITRADSRNEGTILSKLHSAFGRVGCQVPANPNIVRVNSDSNQALLQALRDIKEAVTLIIIPKQDKEKYDMIKKYCSVERGLISQVVTGRLMTDAKKSGGAAVKIAIQVCAKHGGAPWLVQLEKEGTMICGYDTYHDTADRGKSFGAFVASMNENFSSWWSRADKHDKLDELSAHLSENVIAAMKKFKEKDSKGRFPARIVIYRDGVSDGQIEHVFQVEIKNIQKAIKECSPKCLFSFIVVNKRIGARFFMKQGETFVNPSPGCVVDDIVTRNARYDFYLVSQSTRHGTVTPTYYNIIYDDNLFKPEQHQELAYKLCSMYYNWTGTVRVPAPCQYAHKLALLCGEHLHSVPNVNLDDRLHFL